LRRIDTNHIEWVKTGSQKMDVTGLVLSIGEKTTRRAIQSLERQTIPLKEIVLVENVFPFHKAMNEGVSRIRTPFFIQCDADMVLDPDCIEIMQKFIKEDIAVYIGYLYDDLLGKIQAVKMFRTECVRKVGFSDIISPDTDCINRLYEMGWNYIFVRRNASKYGHFPDVLGSHKPEYTPIYTFEKFKLQGTRIRYRGVFQEFVSCLTKLKNNTHPMAMIALIGLCHGLFLEESKDILRPYTRSRDFELLKTFMTNTSKKNKAFAITNDRD
jgi:glycosyltransferase involved in cell wall biosynthesis